MKLHFFCINRAIPNSGTVEKIFQSSGRNLGNMVFMNALWDEIDHNSSTVGYQPDPEKINAEYDAVVIPAANWLSSKNDLFNYYERLKNIQKPCILTGIGAQSPNYNELPLLTSGTRYFLDFIAERSTSIGTRGHFSTEVLKHYGYGTAVTTGCPSFFWGCRSQFRRMKDIPPDDQPENILIQATRHHILDKYTKNMLTFDKNRILTQLALQNNFNYIIQSEYEELHTVLGRNNNDEINISFEKGLGRYYDAPLHKINTWLSQNVKAFLNVSDWADFLKTMDQVITSRLHGYVMCLHAGVPGVLLHHDTRTQEAAEYFELPRMSIEDFDFNQWSEQVDEIVNYEKFYNAFPEKFNRFRLFLDQNGITHNLSESCQKEIKS